MKLRSDYKDAFVEKHGVKLGLMSGFVKVCDLFYMFNFNLFHGLTCIQHVLVALFLYIYHQLKRLLRCLFFFLPIFQAAVSGLQNQPTINAVIDGDDIIYRDYVDISIAVGTPKVCHHSYISLGY